MGREEESTSPGALARKRRRSELGCKRCGEWLNSNLVLDSLERLLNAVVTDLDRTDDLRENADDLVDFEKACT